MQYLCFLIAFLSAFKINIVGELTGAEVLLLLILPFQLVGIVKLFNKPPVVRIVALGGLYLLLLVISDFYREIPSSDYLRGWAKVGMLLFGFVSIVVLIGGNEKRMLAYILGYLAAPLLSIALYGYEIDLYRYYIGVSVSMVAFLICGRAKPSNAKIVGLLPFFVGVFALLMNSRSLAGETFLGGMYNYVVLTRHDAYQKSRKKAFTNVILMGLSCFGVMQLYTYGAPNGWFGEASRAKFEMQANSSTNGEFSLLSGRSEILFSVPKIIESPFLGHGSWAKDADFDIERAKELGIKLNSGPRYDGLIPTHSHIFGGWVEAGLFGGVFWAVVAWKCIRGLALGQFSIYRSLAPVVNFLIILFLWDILFSPFGGDRRLSDAFFIWLVLWPEVLAYNRRKQMARNKKAEARSSQTPLPRLENRPVL